MMCLKHLLKANSSLLVASLAAMRKANETVQPRQRIQTPHEWSKFKHERECKRQEQQKLQIEQAKVCIPKGAKGMKLTVGRLPMHKKPSKWLNNKRGQVLLILDVIL